MGWKADACTKALELKNALCKVLWILHKFYRKLSNQWHIFHEIINICGAMWFCKKSVIGYEITTTFDRKPTFHSIFSGEFPGQIKFLWLLYAWPSTRSGVPAGWARKSCMCHVTNVGCHTLHLIGWQVLLKKYQYCLWPKVIMVQYPFCAQEDIHNGNH